MHCVCVCVNMRIRERERERVVNQANTLSHSRALTVTSLAAGCTSVAFLGSGSAPISNAHSFSGEAGQRKIFKLRSYLDLSRGSCVEVSSSSAGTMSTFSSAFWLFAARLYVGTTPKLTILVEGIGGSEKIVVSSPVI